MEKINVSFRVFRKSENHNSFGLYRMFVMDKKGVVFQIHGSQYNAKEVGEDVIAEFDLENNSYFFNGMEMCERLSEDAPQKVIDKIYSL